MLGMRRPIPGTWRGWAPSNGNGDGVRRDDRRMFGERGFGSRARIDREEQRVVLRPPSRESRFEPLRRIGPTRLDRRDWTTNAQVSLMSACACSMPPVGEARPLPITKAAAAARPGSAPRPAELDGFFASVPAPARLVRVPPPRRRRGT